MKQRKRKRKEETNKQKRNKGSKKGHNWPLKRKTELSIGQWLQFCSA